MKPSSPKTLRPGDYVQWNDCLNRRLRGTVQEKPYMDNTIHVRPDGDRKTIAIYMGVLTRVEVTA